MELIQIGKVLKTHGFKGQLKIFIDEFYMDDFVDMKAIFINGLPYFITGKDINSHENAIISLEEMDTREKAQRLAGKPIFAKEDDLSEILEEDPYGELVGYRMHDKHFGDIGIIDNIMEMPQQFLASVIREDGKEVLIPLNDVFITAIHPAEKRVETELPEGLLEIF
ncbi:MAG TPA: ribosome maturation factor RimM [Chitinophagales bacterium]|jgi:16S rRNA processing protein RimM|nr:ribosome maturation factor RimM [Chitinophagales bacterium]HQO31815.1 ribosome maturation factor RimM [Chitinophagales bacterium]